MFDIFDGAEKNDPFASRDSAEPYRRRAFFVLVISHLVLGILSVLSISQIMGEHRGATTPVNYPGARGGWDSGNDMAHVILAVFGTVALMVCDLLVNDPANFPLRFTKSYRESLSAAGFAVGIAALGCLASGYADVVAVAAYTGCTGCDRAEYIATCLFDIFSFISLTVSALAMGAFAAHTPLALATDDVQAQELMHATAKAAHIELPSDVVAVVAIPAPCCGTLVALSDLASHRVACEADAAQAAAKEAADKLERKRQRKLKAHGGPHGGPDGEWVLIATEEEKHADE